MSYNRWSTDKRSLCGSSSQTSNQSRFTSCCSNPLTEDAASISSGRERTTGFFCTDMEYNVDQYPAARVWRAGISIREVPALTSSQDNESEGESKRDDLRSVSPSSDAYTFDDDTYSDTVESEEDHANDTDEEDNSDSDSDNDTFLRDPPLHARNTAFSQDNFYRKLSKKGTCTSPPPSPRATAPSSLFTRGSHYAHPVKNAAFLSSTRATDGMHGTYTDPILSRFPRRIRHERVHTPPLHNLNYETNCLARNHKRCSFPSVRADVLDEFGPPFEI